MVAYVVADTEIVDQGLTRRYRDLAQQSIAQYGGRYMVRGGAVETLEGGWPPERLVIIEFPSMVRAREWYGSPEYTEALKLARAALRRRLIFVEGVPREDTEHE